MGIATGVLRWPPSEFWRCTPVEFLIAAEGYIQSRGGGKRVPAVKPPTKAEMQDWIEKERRGEKF